MVGLRDRFAAAADEPILTDDHPLRLDDPDSDFRLHVGVKPDRHAVDAERLDRLVQVDLALLDVEALRFELLLRCRPT